ncbi:MAG: hypothetical protein COA94_05970 [Rickettsiales bacterium]|nr:MAG: hypothetical protein COA94_05970 [Rickettsiales bacterium]
MRSPFKLAAFLKYAGGKWATSHRYPKPLSRTIVEPFAGSAGYSVTHSNRRVVLSDTDERIVGAWDWLIKARASDVAALPLLAQDERVSDLSLPQEAKWFLSYRVNIAAGPRNTATRWRMWNARVRRRIALQVHRIDHWRVYHRGYADADEGPATYFVDPPYQEKSFYREGVADYAALGAWVRSLSGQIIVCEGPGASWLPFRKLLDAKTHVNASAAKVPELIWYRCQ